MDLRMHLAGGETRDIEFKRDLNDKDLAKAAACLANGDGGLLVLGVENNGTVVGARPRHGRVTIPERVAAVIQNLTDPPLPVEARLESIDGLEVLCLHVPRADPGPVGVSGYFSRRAIDPTGQPQCVPMTPHEIVSTGMLMRGQDYAASPARGASADDLDPREFDRFRRMCGRVGDGLARLSDPDLLRALGLVPLSAELAIGAILLFGQESALRRWVPNCEFLFHDLQARNAPTSLRLVGPLLRMAEELTALIDERNTTTEVFAGLHRLEIPLIPAATRRESITNALVHRDYAAIGPTIVQIDDNQFTVSNPGGLPPGVTVGNLLDQSRPRSPLLADAFRRAGLVERRGKGINDMFEQQLRAGRDAPNYSRSTADSVVVAVPLGAADLDLVRFLITWEDEHQRPLSLEEMLVVHDVKAAGSATGGEIADNLGLFPATARRVTTRLVEEGILETHGTGRSRTLHLTSRFYDVAHDRNAYVRIRGIEPLQQERMIRDYVDAYGSITRSQAAELCQITPRSARTVLKRMTDAGVLRLVGERRTARYEAA